MKAMGIAPQNLIQANKKDSYNLFSSFLVVKVRSTGKVGVLVGLGIKNNVLYVLK